MYSTIDPANQTDQRPKQWNVNDRLGNIVYKTEIQGSKEQWAKYVINWHW